MIFKLAWRMLTTTRPRLLWKLAVNFGLGNMRAIRRFHRRIAEGKQFPPFMFLSITNECNLRCQGCWVSTDAPRSRLDIETIERIVRQASAQGVRFFGIMGGEPLLHPDMMAIFEKHPRCYFQLFTNGTMLTDDVAARLAKAGNVTPLVSIEGGEIVSDERRGGRDVLGRSTAGLANCLRHGLVTGAATSVCQSNFADLVSEKHLDRMIELGAHYVWYYGYRPSGPNPCPELAMTAGQMLDLRRFVVDMRCRKPIIIVDTYYDHRGRALCPAAAGMSYHINPWGDIEPCPPIQFAAENVNDSDDLVAQIEGSTFLRDFRQFVLDRTRGCVFLERPGEMGEFFKARGAKDATGRAAGYAELAAKCPLCSHHLAGQEIPEKHWAYRLAKKHWFFGFGAYG
jgi:MoaA/NifB/PqqE/SkfB family radical SAM enzyme